LEHIVLIFALCVTFVLLAWRAIRAARPH